MKRTLSIFILLLAVFAVSAQFSPCYYEKIEMGDNLFNNRMYNEAKKKYNTALTCPHPNTAEATAKIKKCDAKMAELRRKAEAQKKKVSETPAAQRQPEEEKLDMMQAALLANEERYSDAFALYRKYSSTNPEAQWGIGNMYVMGVAGLKQDYQEAAKWYLKAAEKGLPEAQHNLGMMYCEGYGVNANPQEAISWYTKAANQGCAMSQHNLGFMYEEGKGVNVNYQEAMRWYRKAAEQGYASAQYNLAVDYFEEENDTEAIKWYRKAAEQGHPDAQNNLGYMYENGYGVNKDVQEAIKWYRKAAAQGNGPAKQNLDRLQR